MSFTAMFYTFSKRINSTMQPSGGSTYNIELKAPSGMLNPTIKLDVGQAGNPTGYNYCYIAEFNRYYWVSNWTWDNRLWVADCKVDALASHKSAIGSYTAYVSRAASSYDLRIVDRYYPAKAQNTHLANMITSPFDKNGGSYVVGIQGKGSGGEGGAVTYYRATASGLKTLINYMLGGGYEVEEISEELLKCIFNPLQYIVSCMWFPFEPPVTSGDITFGWWDATASGISRLSTLEWGTNFSIDIPKHPKAASRGQYLNLPPFATYRLEAGPWGIIPLDNFNLLNASSLTCDYKVDLMTGTGRLNIKYRDRLIYENIQTTQIGVPVQLGQNMFNQGALMGAGQSAINAVGSIASGDIVGELAGGLSAIGNAAQCTQSIPSTMGSNGTRSFNNIFGIMGDFLDIADEDISSRGRPLCKPTLISSLSGYIMCEDADPQIAATDSELREIVSYLNSGFYYE